MSAVPAALCIEDLSVTYRTRQAPLEVLRRVSFSVAGGIGVISHPLDTIVVAACALGIYYWGAATGVPAHLVRLEHEADESEAVDEPHAPLTPATY